MQLGENYFEVMKIFLKSMTLTATQIAAGSFYADLRKHIANHTIDPEIMIVRLCDHRDKDNVCEAIDQLDYSNGFVLVDYETGHAVVKPTFRTIVLDADGMYIMPHGTLTRSVEIELSQDFTNHPERKNPKDILSIPSDVWMGYLFPRE